MSVWTIVVAAGSGRRFGGATSKQYLPLAGMTLLERSLEVARDASDGVVLVVAPDRLEDPAPGADAVVAGGSTRSGSVRAGLAAVPDDAEVEVIIVHDAARPLASPALFASVIEAVRNGADAALPGLAIADTIKRVDGDRVVETVDRSGLVAVQTPQAFKPSALRSAHAALPEATDDAALVESAGGTVVVVPGEPANLKITIQADLALAEHHLADRSS